MKPAAVFPLGEISDVVLRHLQTIAPALHGLFGCAYVSVSPGGSAHAAALEWMAAQDFFQITRVGPGLPVGEQFCSLFQAAAYRARAEQVLHLCYIDRLAFALGSNHRDVFITDIRTLDPADTPLIYRRSAAAWATHPRNYQEIEGMVTRAGELLFHTGLDYAWCHLALQAADLRTSLAGVGRSDLAMVAEMVLALGDRWHTRDVDWLAWEDPFFLGVDADELKRAREGSLEETQKRLAYTVPMLALLQAASRNGIR